MKVFITAAIVALCSSAYAARFDFECKELGPTYVNSFTVDATSIDDEADSFDDLRLNITLRKAGRDVEKEYVTLNRTGKIMVHPAGSLGKPRVIQLQSVEKGGVFELVNLVIDYPAPAASQIRMGDGRTYVANCKSL